jgi:glycosyltransferase involved in cell wall biosynthesis
VPVAVLIPTRDYGQFIAEALESIARQTVLPDEVVVIDDGSADDTQHVLGGFLEANPALPLRVIHHKSPIGFVKSLAEGTALTSAPLIAHIDADDRVLPTYLERLVQALAEQPTAGYAYPRVRLFGDEQGVVLSGPFNPARLVYDGNYIPHIGIIRRDAYDATRGYRDLASRADWDLWLTFLESGFHGLFVDEILYEWRRHDTSMTLTEPSRAFARARVQLGHPKLLARYFLPGLPHLARSTWRRLRIRLPLGDAPYSRTPSCWIEARDDIT